MEEEVPTSSIHKKKSTQPFIVSERVDYWSLMLSNLKDKLEDKLEDEPEDKPKSPKEEVGGKTILEGDSNRKLKNVKKELVNNKTLDQQHLIYLNYLAKI